MVVGEGNGVVISLIYCVLQLHSHSFLSWNDLLYLYIHTTKNTKKWPFSRFSGYDVNRNNYHFGHTRKNLLKFAILKHFRKSCKCNLQMAKHFSKSDQSRESYFNLFSDVINYRLPQLETTTAIETYKAATKCP